MLEYKYDKSDNKFTENGHTMFEEDVLQRLKKLSQLEEKLRWIPVEETLPPMDVELECKIERLSWTSNKFAIGVFSENRVWSIDGRHISHYKDSVNNCVTHYRDIL